MGNLNTPEIRFPEFNGEWKNKKLGDIGDFMGGGTPDTTISHYWEGQIPWISSSDIQENNIHELRITRFITEKAIKESATKLLPSNSILMVSRVGIGKFAVSKIPLCTSQDFTNLLPSDDDPYFLTYNFCSRVRLFLRYSQGTSIKGFTGTDIKNIRLPIPQISEQQKIASFFTAIDQKISQLKRKKTLLEQYKKGVMQKIFSQEIRFKDANGQEFPKWEKRKIKEVFIFKQGIQCGVENQFFEKGEGMVRFIRIIDLTNANEPNRYIKAVGTDNILNKDDLFMVRYGNAGLVGYGYEGTIANNLFRIIPFVPVFNKFYFHVFNYLEKEISSLAGSSTMPALNFSSLSLLYIQFPCVQEQTKIANFLSAIDNKINLTQKQMEHAEMWKKGLMQRMFV